MASDISRLHALEVADALSAMGPVQVRRFFGGSGLVVNGVQFAFVIKGTLYLRVDGTTRAAFESKGAQPFSYATQARRVTVASYYAAPVDVQEDLKALHQWAAQSYDAALKARRKRALGVSGSRRPLKAPARQGKSNP